MSERPTPMSVLGVTPVTRVLAYGQKVVAVAVEYDREVDPRTLDTRTFSVSDSLYNYRFDPVEDLTDPSKRAERTVTAVYTNDGPDLAPERESVPGCHVVVELAPDDPGGNTVLAWEDGVRIGTDLRTTVRQDAPVRARARTGEGPGPVVAEPSRAALGPTRAAVNLLADDFAYERFTGSSGTVLPYAHHVPSRDDGRTRYPLVVVLPGYGMGYRTDASGLSNEGVQVAADIPATAWLQPAWTGTDEQVIVLAPQNQRIGSPAEQAALLLELLDDFSGRFAVDTGRIYVSTVSFGSTLAWSVLETRPGLFRAALVTGGFAADEAQAAAIAASGTPVWVTHGTGDHLLDVRTTGRLSVARIRDAHLARGATPEEVGALVRYTEYPLSAFDEPDQHLAAAPTYQDASILRWLLDQ